MSIKASQLSDRAQPLPLDSLTTMERALFGESALSERILSTADGRRAALLSSDDPELERITWSLFGRDV